MSSFIDNWIQAQPLKHDLIRSLGDIHEYKGKQELWSRQSRQALESMQHSAVIESTVSSNRIEGVTVSPDRREEILEQGAPPRQRSEQELVAYKQVLDMIHGNYQHMPFTPNVVLQLHRDLFTFTGTGGRWKSGENQISERSQDGEVRIRFQPVSAAGTPEAMRRLHDGFHDLRERREIDPLLLISAYVLDFLCIHPFLDGNGRISRVLTLLLLYQSGYDVGRWISLEKLIEENHEGYYSSLFRSSQGWHQSQHDLTPWWEYMIGVILPSAYRKLEARVGELDGTRGARGRAVDAAIKAAKPVFRVSDIAEAVGPGVSRATIERVLAKLKKEGSIKSSGPGAGATWTKVI